MEGSLSSSSSIPKEYLDVFFPKNIDFSPLNSYFDRLQRKLEDPVLQIIDNGVTEQVRSLTGKQEMVEQNLRIILQDSFGTSLDENLEVTACTPEDVAALNVLLGWFMAEEENIENRLVELVRNLVSAGRVRIADVGHLIVSQKPVLDAGSIQLSLSAGLEILRLDSSSNLEDSNGDEIRNRGQGVVTRLLTMMRRVSSSSGSKGNNDGELPMVEELTNIKETMEELRQFVRHGREEQEARQQAESSTRNIDSMRIAAEARMKYLKEKSDSDEDDWGPGLRIHCNIPELDKKLKRIVEAGTVQSESYPQVGGREKMLKWINECFLSKKDYEPMIEILRRADDLEKQLAPALVDLFLLLKRHDHEVIKIIQFKIGMEWISRQDDTSVVKRISNLLEVADEELDKVKQWWRTENADEDVESTERVSILLDELLDKFTMVALNLEGFWKYPGLPDSRVLLAEHLSSLDENLKQTERDVQEIEVKLEELTTRLKYGKFASVVIALANAVSCLQCINV